VLNNCCLFDCFVTTAELRKHPANRQQPPTCFKSRIHPTNDSMAVLKPCVPYCFPSTAVSYNPALFVTFPLHCIKFWCKYLLKFSFPRLIYVPMKCLQRTLFKNKHRALKLQMTCRWFKAYRNHTPLCFYCKQMTSDKRSSWLNILIFLTFCWPSITVYQYNETNVMHFLFNLLRIKGLYVFRALLAHLQKALHKLHLV
jgi:hypothetical protein